MPKRNYVPTENDRQVGFAIRLLRQRRGETLKQTVEASGFGKDASTLAATERGERMLTELEATRLAAHFGTTAAMILAHPAPWAPAEAETEQEWLGNPPQLFAVPEPATELEAVNRATLVIYLDQPLTPAEYREQVWIPYLEHRYATDLQQTG